MKKKRWKFDSFYIILPNCSVLKSSYFCNKKSSRAIWSRDELGYRTVVIFSIDRVLKSGFHTCCRLGITDLQNPNIFWPGPVL